MPCWGWGEFIISPLVVTFINISMSLWLSKRPLQKDLGSTAVPIASYLCDFGRSVLPVCFGVLLK